MVANLITELMAKGSSPESVVGMNAVSIRNTDGVVRAASPSPDVDDPIDCDTAAMLQVMVDSKSVSDAAL